MLNENAKQKSVWFSQLIFPTSSERNSSSKGKIISYLLLWQSKTFNSFTSTGEVFRERHG
jgi:hypothetical protein